MKNENVTTMNISLSDDIKTWVEAQIQTGHYSNASEYVRDLIRRDQEHADKIAVMQKMVDEGLASGISTRSKDEIFSAGRAAAGLSE